MIVFYAVCVATFLVIAYFAFSLFYHWIKYGHLFPIVYLVAPIYVTGTIILMFGAFAALYSLTS